MHCVLCIVLYVSLSIPSIQRIVYQALYSMHYILYIVFYVFVFYSFVCYALLNALFSMHYSLAIVFYALHSKHYIICFTLYVLHSMHCILYIVFYAVYYMHCIPCIILYAFVFYPLYSMHVVLNLLTLLETRCDRPTDRQTDIVRYRAAIAAKNAILTNSTAQHRQPDQQNNQKYISTIKKINLNWL